MENNRFSIIVNSLSQYPEIKLIYITENNEEGINRIACNVIYDAENITAEKSKIIGIIANLEMAKQLIKNVNYAFDYSIKSYKSFKEEIKDKESGLREELNTSEVIYSKIKNSKKKIKK